MAAKKDEWISVAEAARILEMGYQRAREAMFRGRLGKTKREGRFWFVTTSAVKAFAVERKKQANAQT